MIREAGREAVREVRLWRAYHTHRYAILFYTLIVAMVGMPIAATFGWKADAIEFLLGVSLIAAVMPLGTGKTRRLILAGIIVLLLSRPFAALIHQSTLSDSALGLWAAIGLLASAGALRFVLTARRIDSEHIYAALSAYLLAGLFFGLTYWVIELTWPGTFSGPDAFSSERAAYFSFVTLASLGYGDFLPRTDMARGIAAFEAIGGQLFLAVMVARLVSLYTMEQK